MSALGVSRWSKGEGTGCPLSHGVVTEFVGLAIGTSFDMAVLGIDGLPGDNFSWT